MSYRASTGCSKADCGFTASLHNMERLHRQCLNQTKFLRFPLDSTPSGWILEGSMKLQDEPGQQPILPWPRHVKTQWEITTT